MALSLFSAQAEDAATPHTANFLSEKPFMYYRGAKVVNLQNEYLGTIAFIIADLQNARLVEMVASTPHGFLGLARKYTPIPPMSLKADIERNVLVLDMSKARFDAAPKFDKSHMRAATQRDRVAAVQHYYGVKPWFFTDGQKVEKNAEILKLGHLQRTDYVLNMAIEGTGGHYIGRVEALIMDLSEGQISHVVAVTNDPTNPRSIIQPRALRYTKSGNALVLDESSQESADKPYFRWSNGNTTQQEAYVNRKIESDDGTVAHAKVMPQGANFRDRQKTSRIKNAIASDASLAGASKGVEVVTMNAQTTLRGHVGSEKDKARIGEIAMQVGRPENVSNLIEVGPSRGR